MRYKQRERLSDETKIYQIRRSNRIWDVLDYYAKASNKRERHAEDVLHGTIVILNSNLCNLKTTTYYDEVCSQGTVTSAQTV